MRRNIVKILVSKRILFRGKKIVRMEMENNVKSIFLKFLFLENDILAANYNKFILSKKGDLFFEKLGKEIIKN